MCLISTETVRPCRAVTRTAPSVILRHTSHTARKRKIFHYSCTSVRCTQANGVKLSAFLLLQSYFYLGGSHPFGDLRDLGAGGHHERGSVEREPLGPVSAVREGLDLLQLAVHARHRLPRRSPSADFRGHSVPSHQSPIFSW